MIKLLMGADILLAAIFAWRFPSMPSEIPLFYSRTWGEAQIVDYWYIFLLPVLMHIFYVLNLFISKKYFSQEELLQKLFNVVNIMNVLIFSAIFIKILLLVT